jgi:hypothetical protein
MGGEGSGRRKRSAADISAGVKKKSKKQPIYNGPPSYLLDENRDDPFAYPNSAGFPTRGGPRPGRDSSQWGSGDSQATNPRPQCDEPTSVQSSNTRLRMNDIESVQSSNTSLRMNDIALVQSGMDRAKRKERDDDEMYQGLRNFKGRQRGWNGEPEIDRQRTIQNFHDSEHAKMEAQVERERAAAEASRPSVMNRRVTLRQLRDGSELVCNVHSRTGTFKVLTELQVQTRHAIEAMALQDVASRMMEDNHRTMMTRNIDMDTLISQAHGRSRHNLGDIREHNGTFNTSPPIEGEVHQLHSHRRVVSAADSLAASLKENESEIDRPAGIQRPESQSRGFGNDVTEWVEDERKKQAVNTANQQP